MYWNLWCEHGDSTWDTKPMLQMDATNVLSTFSGLSLHWTLGRRVSKFFRSIHLPFKANLWNNHVKHHAINAVLDPKAANWRLDDHEFTTINLDAPYIYIYIISPTVFIGWLHASAPIVAALLSTGPPFAVAAAASSNWSQEVPLGHLWVQNYWLPKKFWVIGMVRYI